MATPQFADGVRTNTFAVLEGTYQPLIDAIDDISRPNEDGHWGRQIGKKAQEFELITTDTCAAYANGNTLINTTYPALLAGSSGLTVTVTTHSGQTITNVELMTFEVLPDGNQVMPTAAGSLSPSDAWIVRVKWRCRKVST